VRFFLAAALADPMRLSSRPFLIRVSSVFHPWLDSRPGRRRHDSSQVQAACGPLAARVWEKWVWEKGTQLISFWPVSPGREGYASTGGGWPTA
jgi:hypothetical protein